MGSFYKIGAEPALGTVVARHMPALKAWDGESFDGSITYRASTVFGHLVDNGVRTRVERYAGGSDAVPPDGYAVLLYRREGLTTATTAPSDTESRAR